MPRNAVTTGTVVVVFCAMSSLSLAAISVAVLPVYLLSCAKRVSSCSAITVGVQSCSTKALKCSLTVSFVAEL